MQLLAAVVLVAWVFAFLRTIVNLRAVPRLRDAAPGPSPPFVSIIVPARDEERAIERSVRALLTQNYPAYEVIVVNDRSTDSTADILLRLAAEHAHLIVIEGQEPPPGWLGKPWALHEGSRRARGELLLFVDADIHYTPGALGGAVAALGAAPMVSLAPHVEMRGFWENAALPMLGFTLFAVIPLWLSNRTRHSLLAVGGGPGNLIRRNVYEAIGGHEALRAAVVDDVGLARLARHYGYQTLVVRADDHVSVRIYHGLREIVHGFTKNMFPVMGRSYIVAAGFIVGLVVVHIWPYVLAAFGHTLGLITVGLITATRLVLFHSLRYRLDNALLLHPVMSAIWLWIGLRSVWYTGFRRQLHWRGRTYDAGQTRFGAAHEEE